MPNGKAKHRQSADSRKENLARHKTIDMEESAVEFIVASTAIWKISSNCLASESWAQAQRVAPRTRQIGFFVLEVDRAEIVP